MFDTSLGLTTHACLLQDTWGNTSLHMAVLYNQEEVVDWIVHHAGVRALTILNDDGFTPLTLTARMGLVSVFHRLLNHCRETAWKYGDVQMSKTSLEQIDTFRIRRNNNSKDDR